MRADRALLDIRLFDGCGGRRRLVSIINRIPISEGKYFPDDVPLGKKLTVIKGIVDMDLKAAVLVRVEAICNVVQVDSALAKPL